MGYNAFVVAGGDDSRHPSMDAPSSTHATPPPILVVDDDDDLRPQLAGFLRQRGYDVVEAARELREQGTYGFWANARTGRTAVDSAFTR